jgi:TRAP transporter TAXI family solute receptor
MRDSQHIRLFLFGFCTALFLLASCSRGPGEEALRKEVQEKLSQQVKPGLLEVVSLYRKGSSPMPVAENGAKRLIVYYNATLKFKQDYDFGSWEKLSPASLAYALGATVKGLFGIKTQNHSGDLMHVYGSSTYEWSAGGWKTVASAPSGVTTAPAIGNTAPPLRSKQLIDKLAKMVDLPPPGPDPSIDDVISEELDRAAEGIERRLDRRKHIYTFASGPRGGEYDRFGKALVDSLKKVGVTVAVRNFETEGSVENAWLLSRGEADYALIQNDVASHAVAGEDQFARGGPLSTLRALGSLFPEPVHIIVRANSSIRRVADLRGKRVYIGMPNSGTQYDALEVLKADGLSVRDLANARQGGFEDAVKLLREGSLDALFVTIGAPNRMLQELSARNKIRLVPIQSQSIYRLIAQNTGLVRFTLPANTYPGQTEDVRTAAATALLVTTSDAPDVEVEKVVNFVFTQPDFQSSGSAEGFKVSKRTALQGITIPMHPGASRYFGAKVLPPKKAQSSEAAGEKASK